MIHLEIDSQVVWVLIKKNNEKENCKIKRI